MRSTTHNFSHRKADRRGAVVHFVAVMMPVFIAFIAFAVDYGVINVAQHQLQNAADAGANGAIQMLTRERESADLAAFDAVTSNTLVGENITFDVRRDVSYGNWDTDLQTFVEIPREGYSPGSGNPDDVSGSTIPEGANAVRVRLIRSAEFNNAIPLFFAPVIGTEFAEIRATAIATVTTGCNGFIGIDEITLRNNMTTDAYNSDLGSYGSGNRTEDGDVCSNGPVSLASGADVFGDAQGSSVTISQGSGATIAGSQTSSPAGLAFDSVDFAEANINDNDTIERGPVWAPPFYNPSTGDLVVNNGRRITLQSGTYRFRDLLLAGGSQLNINGTVRIYIEREMRFNNGTVANQTQLPINLQLFVGDGPVNIQGGHQLHASIYAPEADVTLANGSGFFGAIIGRTLSVAGGGGLHFDESLGNADTAGSEPSLVY